MSKSLTSELVSDEVRQSWRKQAATATSVAAQTNQADVEKAFLDQAYMLIQNKGTPLMKAPYRVGFEIVFKNDENNRMVGIFVFKVDENLYYAPCFFLGGTIKGTDLLYRHTERQFVPLTSDWAEYLISRADTRVGKGVPMSERQFTRHQLELRDLAMPPNTHQSWRKYSSTGIKDENIREFWKVASEWIMPKFPQDSILRRFLQEPWGMDARNKLASFVKEVPGFGHMLAKHSSPDNFAPEPISQTPAAPESLLTLRTNLLRNPGVKSASTQEIQQGWQIEDFRKDAEVNEDVHADPCIYLEQIVAPGQYDALTADGDLGPYLVGYEMDCEALRSDCFNSQRHGGYWHLPQNDKQTLVFVNLNNKESCCMPTKVGFGLNTQYAAMGKNTERFIKCDKLEELSSAKTGCAYRLADKKYEYLSHPFWITRKDKSAGGLTQLWIALHNKTCEERLPLLVNPDYEGFDEEEKICGKNIGLVEVEACLTDDEINFGGNVRLGGTGALRDLIYDNKYKRASVWARPQDEYVVEVGDQEDAVRTGPLAKVAAIAYVAAHCNVRVPLAEELIKESRMKMDGMAFYFKPFEKTGYNLSFAEWPNLHATGNTEFNILEEPHIQDLIQARRDEPYIIPHRVGDAYRHEGINGANEMAADTPQSLAMQSQNRGVGSLFEHGVVGELVKTYDATVMVDKYLPELLTGLDRLGRLLFLLYWKPQDFAQDYGADDQTELENQMLSNFKQQGELILSLLQKSDALKRPDSLGARMS